MTEIILANASEAWTRLEIWNNQSWHVPVVAQIVMGQILFILTHDLHDSDHPSNCPMICIEHQDC